jgi:hypothetical protein
MSDFQIDGNHVELFGALAQAQAEFLPLVRSKTVNVRSDKGNYSFDYAPLEEVLAATLPALNKHGLSILQPFYTAEDGSPILKTIIAHKSGGFLTCSASMARSNGMQQMGSAITYMRRYMLQSILGVNAEEDDDGNAQEGNQRDMQSRAHPAPQPAREQPRRSPPPLPQTPKPEPVAARPAPARAPSEPPPKPTDTVRMVEPTEAIEELSKGSPFRHDGDVVDMPVDPEVPSLADTKLDIRVAMVALGYKAPDVMRKVASVFGGNVKVTDVTTEAMSQRLLAALVRDVERVPGLMLKLPEIKAREKAGGGK